VRGRAAARRGAARALGAEARRELRLGSARGKRRDHVIEHRKLLRRELRAPPAPRRRRVRQTQARGDAAVASAAAARRWPLARGRAGVRG